MMNDKINMVHCHGCCKGILKTEKGSSQIDGKGHRSLSRAEFGRYERLTYLRHVETGVFFANVLDDQFPLTGANVLDRNARIVRHHNQVDGLNGFSVGFHPTNLLSSVHRPTIAPTPHRRKQTK